MDQASQLKPVAFPFGTKGWIKVGKAIELFTAMGCVLNELPGHLEGPGGELPVGYLYSPETDDFVSLLDYEDDEWLPPSELENWERRLGVIIPKGKTH